MTEHADAFHAHLSEGLTTVCNCWILRRRDGLVQGFTDHDRQLEFDGIVFQPDAGLTATVLQQSTGLSVDNAEAAGALSDVSIREVDLHAGRYDGAEVEIWRINWAAPEERLRVFRGSLGEVEQSGSIFRAELRGLAEVLNQPQGRTFRKDCNALFGDARCGVNLEDDQVSVEAEIAEDSGGTVVRLPLLADYDRRWFERGTFEVLSGAAMGLSSVIKNDRWLENRREIELWTPLQVGMEVGDRVRLVAGCDKRAETCRLKFRNLVNFQGFPFMPGDDWLLSYPTSGGLNDGGSLRG